MQQELDRRAVAIGHSDARIPAKLSRHGRRIHPQTAMKSARFTREIDVVNSLPARSSDMLLPKIAA